MVRLKYWDQGSGTYKLLPVGGGGASITQGYCSAVTGGGVTVPSGALTYIPMNDIVNDGNISRPDTVRFNPLIAGYWLITLYVNFDSVMTTAYPSHIGIEVSGSGWARQGLGIESIAVCTAVGRLPATDSLKFWAFQQSGASKNVVGASVSLKFLGAA